MDHRATVRAEIQRPDASQATLNLPEIEPGIFEANIVAAIQGVYGFRVVATGVTLRGVPFTREQLLSSAVILGGDNPPPTSDPSTHAHDKQMCELIECLLRPEALGRLLAEHHVDAAVLQRCVAQWCKRRLGPPSAQEIREREGSTTPTMRTGRSATGVASSELITLLSEALRRMTSDSTE